MGCAYSVTQLHTQSAGAMGIEQGVDDGVVKLSHIPFLGGIGQRVALVLSIHRIVERHVKLHRAGLRGTRAVGNGKADREILLTDGTGALVGERHTIILLCLGIERVKGYPPGSPGFVAILALAGIYGREGHRVTGMKRGRSIGKALEGGRNDGIVSIVTRTQKASQAEDAQEIKYLLHVDYYDVFRISSVQYIAVAREVP